MKRSATRSSADAGGLGGGQARCTDSTEPRLRPKRGSHALRGDPSLSSLPRDDAGLRPEYWEVCLRLASKSGRSSSKSLHLCLPEGAQTAPGAMSLQSSCPWIRQTALVSVTIEGSDSTQPRLPRA